MENNTFIKLYRKLADHEIMRDSTALHIFIWILISVDYKTGKMFSGRFLASSVLGIKPRTYHKALSRIQKKYDLVTLHSDNKKTTISVKNWDKYQSHGDTSGDNKVTTKGQQSDTIQEYKNIRINTYIGFWNSTFGTKYRPNPKLAKNLDYWLETYTMEEIKMAATLAKKEDTYWKDIITPTILLRTKNKSQEPADFIGDLLEKHKDKYDPK